MSSRSTREMEDDRLLAERAAEWLVVLKSATSKEREEFADWLAESPGHVREFLATTALDQELERIRFQGNRTFESLLERASHSVVPFRPALVSGSQDRIATSARHRSIWRMRWAASMAALIVASATVWHLISDSNVYRTAIGEQRTVLLPDGSWMTLTAGTRAEVRFSEQRRAIELLRGEALFKVAQDTRRPFVVASDGSLIQVIGTQFNVAKRPSGTLVSVLEGAVSIAGSDADPRIPQGAGATTLRAGDEARLSPGGRIVKRERIDESTVVAWRQRRLAFRADTLVDIAAEFNRYNQTPRLVVEGDAEQLPRYTGVFDADDPRSLLAFLREDSQITLEEQGPEIIIRRRAGR